MRQKICLTFINFGAEVKCDKALCKEAWTTRWSFMESVCVCAYVVAQSTLCHPMDCSPPGSSVHGDSPGKNTGLGCHALLHEIFPTQESNLGLPHCRQILYHLSHLGSPHLGAGLHRSLEPLTEKTVNKKLQGPDGAICAPAPPLQQSKTYWQFQSLPDVSFETADLTLPDPV